MTTEPKRRPGRPAPDGTKEKLIAFRAPLELATAIESAAGEGSVSDWVRDAIAEKLGQPTSSDEALVAARARIALLETELGRLIASLRGCAAAADLVTARTGVK